MDAPLLDGLVYTAALARANGITAWCLAEMVRRGCVRRLLYDAYVDASVPDTVELRAQAVCLVMPDSAVISRRTAAWLYGIDAYAPDERDKTMLVECVVLDVWRGCGARACAAARRRSRPRTSPRCTACE